MKFCQNNQIKVDVSNIKFKKITGTRFAAVLGLNPWKTPFEAWCEITRTYQKPFEDNQYTIAGKTIEPKQAEYMREHYLMNVVSPADKFGKDYMEKTQRDFYPSEKVFGGMWDYLSDDKVLEMKTTKRVEDWQDNYPEYYALQVALYGYLLGKDDVVLVCSFLDDTDYIFPNSFVPSGDNTLVIPFSISSTYPNFKEDYIDKALEFWNNYVLTGISPPFDEVKDKEILEALRTQAVEYSDDLLNEFDELKERVDKAKKDIDKDEKRLKEILQAIKEHSISELDEDMTKAVITSGKYTITTSKTSSRTVDTTKIKEAGLFEEYSKPNTTYRTTIKEI